MDDELNLDLDTIESNVQEKEKVKNRFEQLSEKVILTSKERDEKAKLAETLQADNAAISKERDFFKDFSNNVSKYPAATEYQEQILEKVKAGYSTEDAIVSILNKEGKLTPQAVQQPQTQVEGGSAPTTLEGTKGIQDMSAEEKFNALNELSNEDLRRAITGK